MSSDRPIRRALLSVSDKTGLVEFARGLAAAGVELVATGGTAAALRAGALDVHEAGEITEWGEMMGGRVKTLHPRIHGAILARAGIDDADLENHGIVPIDLVVANLYPFEATVARADVEEDEAVEMIDIGGPAMIRAAAKNWARVCVVTSPADYPKVRESIARDGTVARSLRRELATAAFARTAAYDRAIVDWLGGDVRNSPFPRHLDLAFERVAELRYGENPHQAAALYRESAASPGTVVTARQLQGKPLSFNNIADAEAALLGVAAFSAPACVIVKHLNPCGAAAAASAAEAYAAAFACDPTSAFGGIVALNRPLDEASAHAILERQFVEVVIAPEVRPLALQAFAAKPNVRVLACGALAERRNGIDFRRIAGGLLAQQQDAIRELAADAEAVTRRAPDAQERRDLDFAWRVVQAVRSNAIVLARDEATVGIGAGQMSRVLAVRIAGLKAREEGHRLAGAVLASDAFFPFRDNVDEAARLGVRAIVQPGGSRRDAEVIAAADEHGIAMVFTRERHFRH